MSIEEPTRTEPEFHRKIAVSFFNETWRLLDKVERTPEEDARMIHSAHASRLHWESVGSAQHLAVGEWQVSRVHAVLRQPDSALYHARRSLEIAEREGFSSFHLGCAHEALARALALSRPQAASEHIAKARKLASAITDPEDRKILEEDLSSILIPLASETDLPAPRATPQ
jgi:hypothetical protein